MSLFYILLAFFKKIEIIFTYNNNLTNLSYLTIEEKLSKNYIIKKTLDYNNIFLFMKYYYLSKYIYYIIGYFIPINITFLNCIPNDIDNILLY